MKTATQQFADFMGISYDDPYIKIFIDKERELIIEAYNKGATTEPQLKYWHGAHYFGEVYYNQKDGK